MIVISEDTGFGEICEHNGVLFHVGHASLTVAADAKDARKYNYVRRIKQLWNEIERDE